MDCCCVILFHWRVKGVNVTKVPFRSECFEWQVVDNCHFVHFLFYDGVLKFSVSGWGFLNTIFPPRAVRRLCEAKLTGATRWPPNSYQQPKRRISCLKDADDLATANSFKDWSAGASSTPAKGLWFYFEDDVNILNSLTSVYWLYRTTRASLRTVENIDDLNVFQCRKGSCAVNVVVFTTWSRGLTSSHPTEAILTSLWLSNVTGWLRVSRTVFVPLACGGNLKWVV